MKRLTISPPDHRCALLFVLCCLLFSLTPAALFAQVPLPTTPATRDGYARAPRLGITFINSTDGPIKAERYQQALFLGAGWNRWPLYWDRVEYSPGQFNWAAYDLLIGGDVRNGLRTNAILMGRPDFFKSGDSIIGLGAPVFADGSDAPGPGKALNPANYWAHFVYAAVQRYMPSGVLAQQEKWPPGTGIRVWEAWNEPDFPLFWTAGAADYARLLKVTYLAAHQADPGAQVMFGGLASADSTDFLQRTLTVLAQDSQAPLHNWYMDIIGVHSYTYARRSAEVVETVRDTLATFGLERRIWLNENGVPVWNDYPGPVWAGSDPQARVLRATMQQQAAFVIQSAAYAWASGAEVVMLHQLYDDCGNQPGGTNFLPNDGNNSGDAHGLFRNTIDSSCFSHHPEPGSPRPSALAYRVLATIFGRGPFQPEGVQLFNEKGVVITFSRTSARERIYVAWNRSLQPVLLDLPANGQLATLYAMDGAELTLQPEDNHYQITLPPATRDDFPFLDVGDGAAVGGPPFIIVEQAVRPSINPALPQFDVPDATPRSVIVPTPGPIVDVARPTVDPAQDITPPSTVMTMLPVVSAPEFIVSWSGQDNSGIASYLVWVRVDGGEWQPWLDTDQTSATYTGTSGSRYEFAVWAVDLAGNWSLNTELTPQTATSVQ